MRLLLILTLGGFLLGCSPESNEPSGSYLGPAPAPAPLQAEEPTPEPPPPPTPDLRSEAYRNCRHFTEKRLKAPASAQWPSYRSIQGGITDLGDTRFSIDTHVDSQNSFGALLRGKVRCTVRYEQPDEMWFLEELWFRDELLFTEVIDHGPEGAYRRCKRFTAKLYLEGSRAKWPQPFEQALVQNFLDKTYRVATFYDQGDEGADVECILREELDEGEQGMWYIDILKIDDQIVFLREGLEADAYEQEIDDFEFDQ